MRTRPREFQCERLTWQNDRMIIAVNVAGQNVGAGLGRASRIAVAEVDGGQILTWEEFEVRWDLSHDQGSGVLTIGTKEDPGAGSQSSHGSHHGRIVSFFREHKVEAVVTGHLGPPMAHTLDLMGISVAIASGDARQAALEAAALLG